MEKNVLMKQLQEIESVTVKDTDESNIILVETNLKGYSIKIDCEKVIETEFIPSPTKELCLQLYYADEGGMIITPNDFVFKVEQTGFVNVSNLPPACSIREMVLGFEHYKTNPNPSDNLDLNFGLFYLHYCIFKSAMDKGFEVPMLAELYKIGKETGYLIDDEESAAFFKSVVS